jgi:methylenetetrahydrofolate dehydrogenase (NADP+)/methenyltetrahydrofolate cyclohydrolase
VRLNLLCIGDIVGRPGRRILAEKLKALVEEHSVDCVIANAENAAGGSGLTPQIYDKLLRYGVNIITLGDHAFRKRDIIETLEKSDNIARPANFSEFAAGRGTALYKTSKGPTVGVIVLIGRLFMKPADCPYNAADKLIAKMQQHAEILVVEFHAEATSEKVAMGWHLDGRVSLIFGTHTHVQTADERLLPGGTACITDAGMTGGFDSVIGMDRHAALRRFLTLLPERLHPAPGDVRLDAVLVTADPATGRALAIRRLELPHAPSPDSGARILSGERPAMSARLAARAEVESLRAAGVEPRLALVSVGDDPASQIYLRKKGEACAEVGIDVRRVALAAGTGTADVVARVRALGDDPDVQGILVQLPLARPADAQAVLEAVPPGKDVDGFHPENAGRLAAGLPGFVPCTPKGILELLRHYEVPLAGRHAVVLGRSNIVGRPLANLLSSRQVNMTVTVGHSASGERLRDLAREADLLVAAIGRPEMIDASWVKPGAVVVDVGMHRVPDAARRSGHRLAGDVDAASVAAVAAALTPVPGGVGPMTVAMVVANTVLAARRQSGVPNV